MPISLDGFVGYIRTRKSRIARDELELWLDPTPRRANEARGSGKVILPKYDCAGVLYLIPHAITAPTTTPDPLPADGFAGYLRRSEDGQLVIDGVLAYKPGAMSYTLTTPANCLGVFYVDPAGKGPMELRYPAIIETEQGSKIYQVQFPTE